MKLVIRQAVLLMLLMLLMPVANAANKFSIEEAAASFSQSSLSVKAKFDLQLSSAVDEALHNGVSLQLLTRLDLYAQRAYIWDRRIARWTFAQQINYHSLTNRYLLTSPQLEGSRSYSSLNDLFDDIENFSFQSGILSETLPISKSGYKLKLRIVLDNTFLPAPLRMLTYISPAWKLRSDIHVWAIASDS